MDGTGKWHIDYQALVEAHPGLAYHDVVTAITPALENDWYETYVEMTPAEHCVDVIAWDTFFYMYDNPCTISDHEFVWNEDVEDRAVVVYGISAPIGEKRPKYSYSMRGPRGEREWGEGADGYRYDRGHLIAHKIGGKAYVGLFPQRTDINRGRSPRGRVYRSMERYCAKNEGVFCFARPVYLDKSVHPFYLEFGILRPDLTFWVELFENRYTDRLFTGPAGSRPPSD